MYASAEQSKHARVQSLASELFGNRHAQLQRIARSNAANRSDAEEALQEAFVLFIEHFDPDSPAPPAAWLTLTLKRLCWTKTQRDRREHLADDLWLTDERGDSSWLEHVLPARIPDTADRIEERHEARVAMASLKPDQRKAIVLFALGHSYQEICELTGWTYTKLNRCLSEGRSALCKAGGEER